MQVSNAVATKHWSPIRFFHRSCMLVIYSLGLPQWQIEPLPLNINTAVCQCHWPSGRGPALHHDSWLKANHPSSLSTIPKHVVGFHTRGSNNNIHARKILQQNLECARFYASTGASSERSSELQTNAANKAFVKVGLKRQIWLEYKILWQNGVAALGGFRQGS